MDIQRVGEIEGEVNRRTGGGKEKRREKNIPGSDIVAFLCKGYSRIHYVQVPIGQTYEILFRPIRLLLQLTSTSVIVAWIIYSWTSRSLLRINSLRIISLLL